MKGSRLWLLSGLLFLKGVPAQKLTVSTAPNGTELPPDGLLSSGKVDLGDWSDAYAQAVSVVSKLTNTEKLEVITGRSVASVNWTSLIFKDGTEGVQGYDYVTGFGMSSALVFTWDKDLMYNQLRAVGSEFYRKGIQVTNAPTSHPLGRTAWGGRLAENLGNDPYLNGIAFGIGSKAFHDAGVIAGGKHFLLNEQETNRQAVGDNADVAPYSSVADDKTLHETYLWSFYDGIKGGLGAVMCAMTKVNGSLSCENKDLLQHYLKTELGFPGLVFADVGGQATALGSAKGGLDLGSSFLWKNSTLGAAISKGTFTQARLDDMAVRNIIGYYHAHLNNGKQPAFVSASKHVDVRGDHARIVRQNGAASIALLKNVKKALPLKRPHSIAVFGAHAGSIMAGPNYEFTVIGSGPTYSGHLAGGSGSGQTSFPYLVTPQHALINRASLDGTMIRWILNSTYTDSNGGGFPGGGHGGGGPGGGGPGGGGPGGGGPGGGGFGNGTSTGTETGNTSESTAMRGPPGLSGGTSISQTIKSYATGAEVCLAFINAFSGEGADRIELRNTDEDKMVTLVASKCPNTIVIVNTVGPYILDSWIENENVTAVLYSGLLGQESGNSIIDVLYGEVNPSGRLPYTIAKNESDYNVAICETAVCNFTEGNYIDYKYFDAFNVTPRYEFGFGLSYTTFNYSDIVIKVLNQTALKSTYPTGQLAVGGKADLWDNIVSVTITIVNEGNVDGNEVAQLYVEYPAEADEPIRQLRGFERVWVRAGQKQHVTFNLRRRDLSFWDTTAQDWAIASGNYVLSVGASSRDLRLSGNLGI